MSADVPRAPLLLLPADLRGIVTMADANEAVRLAFLDWGRYPELNATRQRMHAPSGVRVSVHPGVTPSWSAGGVLIHCEWVNPNAQEQNYDKVAPPATIIYNSDDGELDAVLVGSVSCRELPDVRSSVAVRTAATSTLGTFAMARADSEVLGILGSGDQARNHLVSYLAAHPFKQVLVYSRNPENRQRFAEEMTESTGVPVYAVEDGDAVVTASDVILAATNSNVPVLNGSLLRPGQHVTSIVGSNVGLVKAGKVTTQRREVDDETLRRAARIGVVSKRQAIHDQQGDVYKQVEEGTLTWDNVVELTDLVAGLPGRQSDDEITLFKNNGGMGIADVAVGAAAFAAARKAGIGTAIDA
jgi:ornithine cyclodeaminase/alanine dehydrogenase-like protein (mu-crystallin family)